MNVFGAQAAVTWLMARERVGGRADRRRPCCPPWWPIAVAQAAVAFVVVAVWRGRRLGPILSEPLPVTVRAAETVEGHGRLYYRLNAATGPPTRCGAGTVGRLSRAYGHAEDPARAERRQWRAGRVATRPRSAGCSSRPPEHRRRPGQSGQGPGPTRAGGSPTVTSTYTPRRSHPRERRSSALRDEVGKAVVGQDAAVTSLVIALICRGHVLLEGVPGTAKTLLVRSFAKALRIETKRVQFTPDLMPGDITGSLIYDARTAAVHLPRGPGLHQPDAGRRDQPDAAEDPGRAAGGDGGASGHRSTARRGRCRSRSSSPPPRTRSSTRAPTRCPRPSWTGS